MRRRSWLKLGLVSAGVLAAGSAAVAWLEPGLRESALTPTGRRVFSAVGRVVLEGSLPESEAQRRVALGALLARVDVLVAQLPAHARDELSQLLTLLGSGAGRLALAGLPADWEVATNTQLQQGLQSMRYSRFGLRRQAYQALHDITIAAYFADASTWDAIGYPGPTKI